MDWLISILAGGIGVAIVTGVFKLFESRMNHKADDSKDKRKKVEEKIDKNAVQINTLNSAIRVILHDRIKCLARAHIAKGDISFDDRRDLIDMHKIYHDKLGGNGNLDALMGELMKLSIK